MKLHNGIPFWHQTRETIKYLELNKNEEIDILIIGGGMTGTLISYELAKAGYNLIVVDKNIPGYGSSDGNTGIIQYNSDESLPNMIKKFGEKRAVDFYKISYEAMDLLDEISHEIKEDTGYKRRESIYLCADEKDRKELEENKKVLEKYKFPVGWLEREELEKKGLFAPCAMTTGHDLELNPFKWVQSLHQETINRGNKIFINTEITGIKDNGEDYIAFTNKGFEIKANKIIYATGYAKDIIPEVEPLVERNTTFSLVTEPIDKFWGERELIWDTKEPYLYFRSTEDNRIIAGGRDKKGKDFVNYEDVVKENKKIIEEIKSYYPEFNAEIYTMWQSIFAESKDGIPFIDKRENYRNQYFALGFGGNGTCYAAISAIIIKLLLENKLHPYAYTTSLKGRI